MQREAPSAISRQRSAGTAPASATSSRGTHGTGALGHALPKRRAAARPRQIKAEKEALRPYARTEGALTHHGQTLVPGADRRQAQARGWRQVRREPADYSTVRSIAAALEVSGSGPQGQVRRYLRSKRPKTRGKIEILRSVKDRPKRPMRGLASESGETTRSWQRGPCACLCLPTGQ